MANIKTNKKVGKVNEALSDIASTADADHELQMARSQLYRIAEYAIKLHELMKTLPDTYDLEAWQQAKITKAADYMDAVYHNLEYKLKAKAGGELGAAAPGEIAVGEGKEKKVEKKKYGKMKETNDPYMRHLRSTLGKKTNEASSEYGGARSSARRGETGYNKASNAQRGIDDGPQDDDFAKRQARKRKEKETGSWYIRIDGKLWKNNGVPKEFNSKPAANKAGLTLQQKLKGKKITITSNADTQN